MNLFGLISKQEKPVVQETKIKPRIDIQKSQADHTIFEVSMIASTNHYSIYAYKNHLYMSLREDKQLFVLAFEKNRRSKKQMRDLVDVFFTNFDMYHLTIW